MGQPIVFEVEKLRDHPHRRFLLYELLSPYGFGDTEILERFLRASTGRQLKLRHPSPTLQQRAMVDKS